MIMIKINAALQKDAMLNPNSWVLAARLHERTSRCRSKQSLIKFTNLIVRKRQTGLPLLRVIWQIPQICRANVATT